MRYGTITVVLMVLDDGLMGGQVQTTNSSSTSIASSSQCNA
jgi:hypothetical protein